MVKMIIPCHSGSKFFPLREVPIMKRDAIVLNHCSIQYSPFDMHTFFSVLATPLLSMTRFFTECTNNYGFIKHWLFKNEHCLSISCLISTSPASIICLLNLCKQFGPRSGRDKMSSLIWIKAVWHPDGIPEFPF